MIERIKAHTPNIGLAKAGLTCISGTFVLIQTFVLSMNFGAKNPCLRQAENRYVQPNFNCTVQSSTIYMEDYRSGCCRQLYFN